MSIKTQYIVLGSFLFLLFATGTFLFGYAHVAIPTSRTLSIEETAEHALDQCKNGARKQPVSKETCYSQQMQEVALHHGHQEAFAILFALQKKDPDAIGCHFISHGIGYGTYEREPNNWQQAINTINQSCTYGAVHGIIEKYIATLPHGLTRDIIPTICGSKPLADCNHIIGHLLLVETRGSIKAAVDLCNVFENLIQKEFCLTGVFMEEITALNLIKHGYAPESWLNWPNRVEALEKICRSYDGAPFVACWKEIVHAVILKFQNDPSLTFTFCNTSPIQEAAMQCRNHAIGIIAASSNFYLPDMKKMCLIPQPHDPDFEKNCYVQLVASALSTSHDKVADVITMCNSIPPTFQNRCFSQIGYNLQTGTQLNSETIKERCLHAPPSYQSLCMGQRH